jgi:hypothetical protein
VRTAGSGGELPLALGVSTVRYPIPERNFDYISTVRSATAGTCQNPTSLQLNEDPDKLDSWLGTDHYTTETGKR